MLAKQASRRARRRTRNRRSARRPGGLVRVLPRARSAVFEPPQLLFELLRLTFMSHRGHVVDELLDQDPVVLPDLLLQCPHQFALVVMEEAVAGDLDPSQWACKGVVLAATVAATRWAPLTIALRPPAAFPGQWPDVTRRGAAWSGVLAGSLAPKAHVPKRKVVAAALAAGPIAGPRSIALASLAAFALASLAAFAPVPTTAFSTPAATPLPRPAPRATSSAPTAAA